MPFFKWPIIILLVVLLPFSFVFSYPYKDSSLYTYLDPVNILYTSNATNYISQQHKDSQKLQLVQFYSSWCGHCIDFAPRFKKFLKTIRSWRHWLDISVLDCAQEVNLQGACVTYEIQYYPCLKMFWFKPNENETGKEIKCKCCVIS